MTSLRQVLLRRACLAFVAVALLGTHESSASTDLVLECYPPFAVNDTRRVRPDYVRTHRAAHTYFLFSNSDLLYYRVMIRNIGPTPRDIGNDTVLPRDLLLRLQVDGASLPAENFQVTPIAPAAESLETGRLSSWEDHSTDTWSWERMVPEESFERSPDGSILGGKLPSTIQPGERLGLLFLITKASGDWLADGKYSVDFFIESLGLSCEISQSVVIGDPETELDIVDDFLARYHYLHATGSPEQALAELHRGLDVVPESIELWYTAAADAHRRGDLTAKVSAAERLELLLGMEKSMSQVSVVYQTHASGLVSQLEELRNKLRFHSKGEASNKAGEPIQDW